MKDILLQPDDYVGVSFWLLSAAMSAATLFFFMERDRAVGKWKTSLSVAALVTGISAINYFYMRHVWVVTGASPTTYRYVDWFLTVPLQITEFFLILNAVTTVRICLFWKLLSAAVAMLVLGYFGETHIMNLWLAFILSTAAWFYIIYEIFAGEAGQINADKGSEASQRAFAALRAIVTFGWAIYPIGYVIGYTGAGSEAWLNGIYNLADFLNKIAFGVVIWAAATSHTESSKSS